MNKSLTEETSSVDEGQRLLKQQLGFEVIHVSLIRNRVTNYFFLYVIGFGIVVIFFQESDNTAKKNR